MRILPARRLLVGWILITFLFWVFAVATSLFSALNHSRAAEALLVPWRQESVSDFEDLFADGELKQDLTLASHELGLANAELSRWVLAPLRLVPVVRSNLRAARNLSGSGSTLTKGFAKAVADAEMVMEDNPEASRAQSVKEMGSIVAELLVTVDQTSLPPEKRLLTSVFTPYESYREFHAELTGRLASADTVLTGLEPMMSDSRYLLLVRNNAEMRLAGGMPLSIGVIEVVDGVLGSVSIMPTWEHLPLPVTPVLDPFIEDRWGFLFPTTDYAKLGYSARMADWIGPQAELMWETQYGTELDGVISIDPVVLGAVLGLSGPVQIGDRTLIGQEITEYLLVDQYQEFDENTIERQDERRRQQAQIAASIASALQEAEWGPLELAKALRPVVKGGHVQAYSSNPVQQAAFDELGVSGRLTGSELGVFLLNLGASKLDPYVDVAVSVEIVRESTLDTVTLSIEMSSRSTPRLSDYSLGLWDQLGIERGEYIGRLAFYLPGAATEIKQSSSPSFEVFGPDGPVWILASRIRVPPGETVYETVTFELPEGQTSMSLFPSMRYPAETWTFDGDTFTDEFPRDLTIEAN